MEPLDARGLWQRLESLHAVTYFAEESRTAAADAGLRGFWMGYFGFRAAPLGAVGHGLVTALFANFAPTMVARSIPDAWRYASPDRLVVDRSVAAAAALRRVAPSLEGVATQLAEMLATVVATASSVGRPMFAANAAVDLPDDPVGAVWQLATTLREHRGDAHVSALADAGVDGCEAHLLHAAEHGTHDDVLRPNRGWTDDEWSSARTRLQRRGLLGGSGLTVEGRALRARVESATDRLAAVPFAASLDPSAHADLLALAEPPALEVAASGVVPFPNPMGLPPPATWT